MHQKTTESSSPTICSHHVQLQYVVWDCVQLGFAYLQGWKLCNFLGQPAPVFDHPDSKKVLLYV